MTSRGPVLNPYRDLKPTPKEQETTPSKTKQPSLLSALARCCCAPRVVVVALLVLVSLFMLAFHHTHRDVSGVNTGTASNSGIVSKLTSKKMFTSSSNQVDTAAAGATSSSSKLRGAAKDSAPGKHTDIHKNKMIHNNIQKVEAAEVVATPLVEAAKPIRKATEPPHKAAAATEPPYKASATEPLYKAAAAVMEPLYKAAAAVTEPPGVPGYLIEDSPNRVPVARKRMDMRDKEALVSNHEALGRQQQAPEGQRVERLPPVPPAAEAPESPGHAATDHHIPARYMHKSGSSINSLISGRIGKLAGSDSSEAVATTEQHEQVKLQQEQTKQLLVQQVQVQEEQQRQDLPTRTAPVAVVVAATAAPKLGNFCDSPGLDPYRGVPVDSFTPPVKADFKSQAQWKENVDKMMASVRAMNVGGTVLRQFLVAETKKLEELRFSLFCKYGYEG